GFGEDRALTTASSALRWAACPSKPPTEGASSFEGLGIAGRPISSHAREAEGGARTKKSVLLAKRAKEWGSPYERARFLHTHAKPKAEQERRRAFCSRSERRNGA